MGRFDGNLFRAIGFDKPLLNSFADYFANKALGEDLNLAYDLFESLNEKEPALFYQALDKDKLVVDIYLRILTHAEQKLDL